MTRRQLRTVALVLPGLGLGGAERQALALARRLPRHGWRPIMIVPRAAGPLLPMAREAGIPVFSFRPRHDLSRSNPLFWWHAARAFWRLIRIFRRQRVTVVYSWLFWESVLAVPAARLTPGVRAVVTGRRGTGEFKDDRPHYQAIENILNRLTDCVVANASGVAKDCARRERLARHQLKIVPNGVNVDRFANAEAIDLRARYEPLRRARPLVGMVASFKPAKRQDLFLRALLLARARQETLKGILIGPDRGEQRRIEGLAHSLGLDDDVVFAGPVERGIERWIAGLDILMLPSDAEGMPNALLEAMAAGKPVIATRVSGSESVVRHEETGLLVPRGDITALAEALDRLCADPKTARRWGENAQNLVREKFSMERMAERHARLFDELVGR